MSEHDGSVELLALLVGHAAAYVTYAAEYFEIDVPEEVVARFFRLEPVTPALARALFKDAVFEATRNDLGKVAIR